MLRFAFKTCLVILVLGIISFLALFLYVWPKLPDINELRDVRLQTPVRIYSHDGSFIGQYGEVRRDLLKINEAPKALIHAVLATEDSRFYEHPGVDWHGVVRAAINYIKTGRKSQGASTITMQVARHYFYNRKKTWHRKINEAFLSLKIERELTKDEILELYLNSFYLGQRANGVGAAAQVYYGTTIDNLTLAQQAMIAGLFQSPSTDNPVTSPANALKRRNHVLRRMLDLNYITQEEYKTASDSPITASLHQPEVQLQAPYIAEMVRREIINRYGDGGINDGYKVYTTVRDVNQRAANQALRKDLEAYDKRHGYRGPESHYELTEKTDADTIENFLEPFKIIGGMRPALVTEVKDNSVIAQIWGVGRVEIPWDGLSWARKYIDVNRRGAEPQTAADILKAGDIIRVIDDKNGIWTLTQIPEVEGALVSVDPNNGATLALVGGFDFNRSKYNRVTQALRQPGSSFKPFVYSAALAHGYTAATMVNDAPIVKYEGSGEVWKPQNYERGESFGPVRLRDAITRSLNLVSARILDDIGLDYGLKYFARFGFDVNRMHHNLTLALGSESITPWESATAYSVLANGGYKVELYFIEHIEDYNGKVVYQADPVTVCHDCDENTKPDEETGTPAAVGATEATDTEAATEATGTEADQPPVQKLPEPQPKYAKRVIEVRNDYIINSMTRSVIQDRHGTGHKAMVLNREDLSGKTGTTNDQRDAWFAGYNSSIVTVCCFDDNSRLGNTETGAKAALPMWIDYMRVALKNIPEVTPPPPPHLTYVRIDPKTGKPTGADTPGAFFEIFRDEYAPKEVKESRNPNLVPEVF